MAKLFITDISKGKFNKKCGGCNWETTTFYGIGESKEGARKDFEGVNDFNYGLGLCSSCTVNLIREEKYEIN